LLQARAQEDFPPLDRCGAPQPQTRPRIAGEAGLGRVLIFGGNDEEEFVLPLTQWTAPQDQSVV
jgi:hypothetical protein